MKNAILFGNGFNLLSDGCPSWDELLASLTDKEHTTLINDLPPTLQYEQVYLSPNMSVSNTSHSPDEMKLKKAVKENLKGLSTNEFYKTLRNLDVNLFLTTNYDHAFYDNNEKIVEYYCGTEKLYSIRRWGKIHIEGKDIWLYPIHGDIKNVKTIMLGLDHYGGALAKVQDFVKGNYHIKREKEKQQKIFPNVPSIKRRLNENKEIDPSKYGFKDSGSGLLSWIDAFFFTNLHIIGIALDFSEIDIWWLLSRRARLSKSGMIKNKIYYYPTFPMSEIHKHRPKLEMLKRLDVHVIYSNPESNIQTEKNDYPSIYDIQINNLKKNL